MTTYADASKGPLLGHQDTHRLIKALVKAEMTAGHSGFSETLCSFVIKHLEKILGTRGVFVVVELMEHEVTKKIIGSAVKKEKKNIEEMIKAEKSKGGKATGLEILIKLIK